MLSFLTAPEFYLKIFDKAFTNTETATIPIAIPLAARNVFVPYEKAEWLLFLITDNSV